jgi:hypothetical protein
MLTVGGKLQLAIKVYQYGNCRYNAVGEGGVNLFCPSVLIYMASSSCSFAFFDSSSLSLGTLFLVSHLKRRISNKLILTMLGKTLTAVALLAGNAAAKIFYAGVAESGGEFGVYSKPSPLLQ